MLRYNTIFVYIFKPIEHLLKEKTLNGFTLLATNLEQEACTGFLCDEDKILQNFNEFQLKQS